MAFYTITPLFSFFLYLRYRYIRGQGNSGGVVPIIIWRLLADTVGPNGQTHLLGYVNFLSSPRGPRATIGSTGGYTMQFLMVRVPRVGGGGGIE